MITVKFLSFIEFFFTLSANFRKYGCILSHNLFSNQRKYILIMALRDFKSRQKKKIRIFASHGKQF